MKNIEQTSPMVMLFEDEEVLYIEHNGEKLYPVPFVGGLYGYSRDDSLKAFQRNRKFLVGNYFSVKLSEIKYKTSVPCLTGKGVLIYSARLGTGRLPEEREEKVIRVVDFMAESAMHVLSMNIPGVKIGTNWDEQRSLSKESNKMLMQGIKEVYTPQYENGVVPRYRYSNENIMINNVAFGHHKKGMRNDATFGDLVRLTFLENADATMCYLGLSTYSERKYHLETMKTKYMMNIKPPKQLKSGAKQTTLPAN